MQKQAASELTTNFPLNITLWEVKWEAGWEAGVRPSPQR